LRAVHDVDRTVAPVLPDNVAAFAALREVGGGGHAVLVPTAGPGLEATEQLELAELLQFAGDRALPSRRRAVEDDAWWCQWSALLHSFDQLSRLLLQGGAVQGVVDDGVVRCGAEAEIDALQIGVPRRELRRVAS